MSVSMCALVSFRDVGRCQFFTDLSFLSAVALLFVADNKFTYFLSYFLKEGHSVRLSPTHLSELSEDADEKLPLGQV